MKWLSQPQVEGHYLYVPELYSWEQAKFVKVYDIKDKMWTMQHGAYVRGFYKTEETSDTGWWYGPINPPGAGTEDNSDPAVSQESYVPTKEEMKKIVEDYQSGNIRPIPLERGMTYTTLGFTSMQEAMHHANKYVHNHFYLKNNVQAWHYKMNPDLEKILLEALPRLLGKREEVTQIVTYREIELLIEGWVLGMKIAARYAEPYENMPKTSF